MPRAFTFNRTSLELKQMGHETIEVKARNF